MNPYIIQLIAIVFIGVIAFVFIVTFPIQDMDAHVRDPDKGMPGRRGMVSLGGASTFGSLILFGLLMLGFAILSYTHFDLCSFMHYWSPDSSIGLPLRCS